MFINLRESRQFAKGCISIVLTTAVLLAGCRSLENHFIFNPSVYPNDWNSYSDFGFEDAWFVAEDGTRLHGLYAKHPTPKAIVLFAHGRRGNVTSPMDKLLRFVNRHQVSVLIFDYRGYGRSSGKPDEPGIYQDARAARKWLAQRAGLSESAIVLMGRSLGAAVAIELAAEDGAGGLIVENGFTSLNDFVKHHVPPVPADLILRSEFNSIEKIEHYHGPLLICHGRGDRVVPFEHGQALFEAAPGPKHFFRCDGGHESDSPDSYRVALDQFFDDLR